MSMLDLLIYFSKSVTYSTTTHQRSVEVQFGRYKKIFCRSDIWPKISHVLVMAAWNVFPIHSLPSGSPKEALKVLGSSFYLKVKIEENFLLWLHWEFTLYIGYEIKINCLLGQVIEQFTLWENNHKSYTNIRTMT